VECQGSIFVIGGLHNRGHIPIKIVEAYDLKISSQWRRCASMFIERSEFTAVSSADSHFIYVFGGTLKPEERYVIERYDAKEDLWEIMSVRLSDEIPFTDIFNTFCTLVTPLFSQKTLTHGSKPEESSLEMTREEMLI